MDNSLTKMNYNMCMTSHGSAEVVTLCMLLLCLVLSAIPMGRGFDSHHQNQVDVAQFG